MENIIVIAVLVFIVGLASGYIYKAKKSGKKCIGCPAGGACSGSCGGCGGACSRGAEKAEKNEE